MVIETLNQNRSIKNSSTSNQTCLNQIVNFVYAINTDEYVKFQILFKQQNRSQKNERNSSKLTRKTSKFLPAWNIFSLIILVSIILLNSTAIILSNIKNRLKILTHLFSQLVRSIIEAQSKQIYRSVKCNLILIDII